MATRTISNAGGNYNAVGTWVEGIIPTSADDVVFTATSGNLTVNVVSVCKSINFSLYTSTITFNNNLNVSGTINLGTGGYTVAGSVNLGISLSVSSTITSNGVVWSVAFATVSGITTTFADNFTHTGNAFLNGGTINGSSFIFKGATIQNNSTVSLTGTTILNIQPTTSCVLTTSSTGEFRVPITFTSGTINIGTNLRLGAGCTLTRVGGTVVTTSSTLTINTGATTLDTNIAVWNIVICNNNITLLSELRANTIQFGSGGTCSLIGSFGFIVNNFSFILSDRDLNLTAGTTYTINTSMTCLAATLGSKNRIQCSTVNGIKAKLNLAPGATQDNGYLSATDIDSSGRRSIWTYKGVLTRTINWNVMSTNPKKHLLKFGSKILK
jgi:hypothetical protein